MSRPELMPEEIDVSSVLLTLSVQDVQQQLDMIELQLEISKYFEKEAASGGRRAPARLLHEAQTLSLFAGIEEKERAASMALILGEQTEQGFGICFKVIKVRSCRVIVSCVRLIACSCLSSMKCRFTVAHLANCTKMHRFAEAPYKVLG